MQGFLKFANELLLFLISLQVDCMTLENIIRISFFIDVETSEFDMNYLV